MKAHFFISVIIGSFILLTFSNCHKVENPYPEQYAIDTTLYPGLWEGYLNNEYPVFIQNTNTLRNALIEDYTGKLVKSVTVYSASEVDLRDLAKGLYSLRMGVDVIKLIKR
jgi:hypothetical protein